MAHTHAPGLVLHMYPEVLLKFGASHTVEPQDAVAAQHYFVCLSADATDALWTPLYLTRGDHRLAIPEAAKAGNARWTRGPSYYDPDELWRIPAQGGATRRGGGDGPVGTEDAEHGRVGLAAKPRAISIGCGVPRRRPGHRAGLTLLGRMPAENDAGRSRRRICRAARRTKAPGRVAI